MFKVSNLNPKDVTLDEIHGIQKKIYAEDNSLSSKDLIERYNSSIRELSKEYKINFQVISSKAAHV
jgi:hypothetical protein